MRLTSLALALALGAGASSTVVSDARACGGTFCDSPSQGQSPMPVDQSGENILFARDGAFIEAHVQIQYTGDPEQFAWIIPVPATPELSIGSQLLFLELLNTTVPTFQITRTFDSCSFGGDFEGGGSSGCSFGMSSDDAAAAAPTSVDGAATQNELRETFVEARESVGAFDITIIDATSAADVSMWLSDNGYLDEPEAPAIIEAYIAQGFKFVAVKLSPGAGVDEIHPLVIRYEGTEPCIPLKLTRIAATEDMGVRAFFLDQKQIVPAGEYRHVMLNDVRLDWPGLGGNYQQVVSAAIDEAPGGHGFITEFAGSPNVVNLANVLSSSWNAEPFYQLPATAVVQVLTSQGLMNCASQNACSVNHPLLLTLLRTYLPTPQGMSDAAFYSCLSCFESEIDVTAWDSVAFADDLILSIIEPAEHAAEIVGAAQVLTRLFTTISPEEMTDDPMFAAVDLSPVNRQKSATVAQECNGSNRATLDNGTTFRATSLFPWPAFSADMPFAERIVSYHIDGTVLFDDDRGEEITKILQANEPPLGANSSDQVAMSDSSSGCGCRVGSRGGQHGLAFLAIVGLAMLRRRRRRHGV